jgi:hypothetical protein
MPIAGTGEYGVSTDGGSAAASQLAWPAGLAIDGAANLYVAENAVHRVRRVSPQGVITTNRRHRRRWLFGRRRTGPDWHETACLPR